ncbi:hypothetical protein BDY19DRAFT_909581 [Irpex rosettiformis]|uniref:Uncharacterized protein n=1 Tax=Irpex rosettiformis TaxID=378272 RepID=A0ACB8TSL0_9APHY|nr:hypothetical protein BDY19DRAFT_909581 [Irpex rosettiformis]
MFSKSSLVIASTVLLSSLASALSIGGRSTTYLEATTLVPKNGTSALECWRFASPLSTSAGAGTAGASTLVIDNLANATYTVIPPRFEGGVHNAPHAQLVAFLSGTIHITIPTDPSAEAWVQGGINGLILALDTTGSGHNTSYPGNVETRALQIPFDEGFVPDHVVLYEGPCQIHSQVVTI